MARSRRLRTGAPRVPAHEIAREIILCLAEPEHWQGMTRAEVAAHIQRPRTRVDHGWHYCTDRQWIKETGRLLYGAKPGKPARLWALTPTGASAVRAVLAVRDTTTAGAARG